MGRIEGFGVSPLKVGFDVCGLLVGGDVGSEVGIVVGLL